MAYEDEREIDSTDTAAPDADAFRVETPEEDERLAASQRKIDEAKAVAADLAETTPDPLPDSDPPQGSTPGS
ncbi:hypothetical protein AB0K14_25445 [Actinosynnema sp. NPDC050801]|uniref:hypothetical protein n=1 Tax=unclassified Actinosynnema TaxID=2637065 RepID=UPI0033E88BC8